MARAVFDKTNPTVGLLNIGVEEVKGLEQIRDAGQMLREANFSNLDYVGFVEGDDIGKGTVDVVVTEGFTGNIALKTAEGTAQADRRLSALRHESHADRPHRLSASPAAPSTGCARRWTRPGSMAASSSGSTASSSRATAAPNPEGFASAIELGYSMVQNDLLSKINQDLTVHHQMAVADAAVAKSGAM